MNEQDAGQDRFWRALDELVASRQVVIDRPRGSAHPRYPDWIYPLDYGYLEGTRSSDGAGVDVWVGSQHSRIVTGVIGTVDSMKGDMELKVLLGCTSEEAHALLAFLNDGSLAAFLYERYGGKEKETDHD